jgi:hypothetical protein
MSELTMLDLQEIEAGFSRRFDPHRAQVGASSHMWLRKQRLMPADQQAFDPRYSDWRSYDRPQVFDPDRSLPERAVAAPRFAMLPFGVGNRDCPADEFTMVEAALMLATVAARWRTAAVAATDLTVRPGITLRPRRLLMRVEPRSYAGGRP